MKYLLIIILWTAWCALHSAMISLTFTEWLRKRFPGSFRFYRIFFNLFSVATLLLVILITNPINGDKIVTWAGAWRFVLILLGATALFFFLAGTKSYDILQFIGWYQIKDEKTCSVLTDDCSLNTDGILSVVRHPWYIGGILIVWARPLDLGAILTNVVLNVYFVVGAMLEERKLVVQFGRQYKDYQKQVSMLIPIKWARKKFL